MADGPTAGTAWCCSRNDTLPNVTTSPVLTGDASTRVPLTNVPLLEPRSRTLTPTSEHSTSAWRREIVGSMTGMSLFGARPTTSVAPARSSKLRTPSEDVSLKGIGPNMGRVRRGNQSGYGISDIGHRISDYASGVGI